MNFKNMKLENLQIHHSEMCATAGDLGVKVPETLTVEFDTEVAGVPICEQLDKLIQDHNAKKNLASAEGKAQSEPRSRDVKSGPETTKKMAAQKAARLAGGKPAPAATAKSPKKDSAQSGEEPVAKKAVAKKAAKKTVAKKKAANGGGRSAKFDENAKVTWVAKENPAREGSARFDRYEKLRKGSGKTVKALIAAGVPSATIANAASSKTVTVKA